MSNPLKLNLPVIGYSPSALENNMSVDSYNWSDMCILVVEDNYISFKLLEVLLSRTGINIVHAENGITAIKIVMECPEINLVLMDIQLPLMNGYEATMKIKEIRPELVVIAQTANAMEDDRQKCLNSGCTDYISKPIVFETMLSLINAYIRKT
jgi:two-component system, cell cycle response regulator DivK